MNKADLIEQISADSGINKSQANRVLDSFTETVIGTLKKGESVMISGFGTFLMSQRQERRGRNPQTGETITLSAASVPRFKAGRHLVSALAD